MQNTNPIERVRAIATGYAKAHVEHIRGTSKPDLWWIFFGRERVKLPVNVYVIEHKNGLVLFDAGVDTRIVTDPNYWPDPITGWFMRNIFEWGITPEDNLANQLDLAGYSAADVSKVVISHFHADHVGGIHDVPQAELFAAREAWEHMMTPKAGRKMVLRKDIAVLGAKWNEITFSPTDDPDLAPFTQSFDLMGDGSMIILPTPGHMPGSVSMLVRRSDGPPLLMIGDLTYGDEFLEQDITPATGDTEVLLDTFAKVRTLRETMPDLVLLPAHDLTAAEKLGERTTGITTPAGVS